MAREDLEGMPAASVQRKEPRRWTHSTTNLNQCQKQGVWGACDAKICRTVGHAFGLFGIARMQTQSNRWAQHKSSNMGMYTCSSKNDRETGCMRYDANDSLLKHFAEAFANGMDHCNRLK